MLKCSWYYQDFGILINIGWVFEICDACQSKHDVFVKRTLFQGLQHNLFFIAQFARKQNNI